MNNIISFIIHVSYHQPHFLHFGSQPSIPTSHPPLRQSRRGATEIRLALTQTNITFKQDSHVIVVDGDLNECKKANQIRSSLFNKRATLSEFAAK